MMFSELSKIEIRKPFTVATLFDENFYVNFKNVFEKEGLIKDIIVSGSSFSLTSLEDGEFIFEECGTKMNEEVTEKLNSLFENENQVILVTAGFSEDNAVCESVMDDEKDRILMCAYIKTLFDIFFKRYGMENEYAVFHSTQITGEYVELPHVHCVLCCEKENEGYQKFLEDFKDNIFDE